MRLRDWCKKYILEILWFVALVLLIGAEGNIEVCETLPVDSVVLAVVSVGYIIFYVFIRCINTNLDRETWEEMERDWNKVKKWW